MVDGSGFADDTLSEYPQAVVDNDVQSCDATEIADNVHYVPENIMNCIDLNIIGKSCIEKSNIRNNSWVFVGIAIAVAAAVAVCTVLILL